MEPSGQWHRVAALADIPDDAAKPVRAGGVQIALCRYQGEIYAFEDVCTHEYASLSQGCIEGDEIECPLHGARFEITNGRCITPPATRDLRTFPVRIEGDDVYVAVPFL